MPVMKKKFTYEKHLDLAKELKTIFECIDRMFTLVQGHREWPAKVVAVWKRAKQLQVALEADMSLHDGTDLRSWALYFPKEHPSRIWYG
jgi:hypothetical protein